MCFKQFHKIYSKTSELKPLFNKLADLIVYKFITKKLQQRRFPVCLPKFLKRTIL